MIKVVNMIAMYIKYTARFHQQTTDIVIIMLTLQGQGSNQLVNSSVLIDTMRWSQKFNMSIKQEEAPHLSSDPKLDLKPVKTNYHRLSLKRKIA